MPAIPNARAKLDRLCTESATRGGSLTTHGAVAKAIGITPGRLSQLFGIATATAEINISPETLGKIARAFTEDGVPLTPESLALPYEAFAATLAPQRRPTRLEPEEPSLPSPDWHIETAAQYTDLAAATLHRPRPLSNNRPDAYFLDASLRFEPAEYVLGNHSLTIALRQATLIFDSPAYQLGKDSLLGVPSRPHPLITPGIHGLTINAPDGETLPPNPLDDHHLAIIEPAGTADPIVTLTLTAPPPQFHLRPHRRQRHPIPTPQPQQGRHPQPCLRPKPRHPPHPKRPPPPRPRHHAPQTPHGPPLTPMKPPTQLLTTLATVLATKTESFTALAAFAGLEPATAFRSADLRHVDFGTDDLAQYDFSGANLKGAKISKARGLKDLIWDTKTVWPDGFHPATPENFDLDEAHLKIYDGEELPENWKPFIFSIDFGPRSTFYKNGYGYYLESGELAFKDLSGFKDLFHLQKLNLNRTSIMDINFVSNLKNLKSLHINATSITDLKPISKLRNLISLDLNGTGVDNLEPISEILSLKELILNNTPVRDLRPLSSLENLQNLYLNSTPVTDLTPIAQLRSLQSVHLIWTGVRDAEMLSHVPNLFVPPGARRLLRKKSP